MDEIKIFIASLCAGVILGAPVGVAGAMVADAALAHSKKRLYATIIAAAFGDATLAALSTLFSVSFKKFLQNYEKIGLFTAGIAIVAVGITIITVTYVTHNGMMTKENAKSPSSKWIISHFAPVIAAFLIALMHPGNIAAFMTLMTVFSLYFPDFGNFKFTFIAGIFTGSFLVFSLAGFLFWKIREKAERFVHYLRYTLAVIIIVAGVYLIISHF